MLVLNLFRLWDFALRFAMPLVKEQAYAFLSKTIC